VSEIWIGSHSPYSFKLFRAFKSSCHTLTVIILSELNTSMSKHVTKENMVLACKGMMLFNYHN